MKSPSFRFQLWMAFLLVLSSNANLAYAKKVSVSFNSRDVELLKTIERKEKAAGQAATLLKWAPLATLISSAGGRIDKVVSFTFTLASTDWGSFPKMARSMQKIKNCVIEKDIQLHFIGLPSGAKRDFFERLAQKYGDRCSR